ncbi:hypothetical protein OOT00_03345 [Desulfobotulus sp. H1]|uniref:Uncharacterized protein n=1 Tax=Desulfobotulus pelophilus TaxID=2823377 RepID=A0ABT3N7K3_9BACT|nr:hypothetical protein [Desulfobotulus pelophilus]MCW7753017.1 hypothetical protein [Desulfobotulus pelophilus]
MIQPISGNINPYNVSPVQQVMARPPHNQGEELIPQQAVQDAAIFTPSETARAMMTSGYGPEGTVTSSTTPPSAAAPAQEAQTTASPAERAQNLYQQPESVIREFTQAASHSIQQGQQVDIMV